MTHEAGWAHAPGALRGPAWLRQPDDVNALLPLLCQAAVNVDQRLAEAAKRGDRDAGNPDGVIHPVVGH